MLACVRDSIVNKKIEKYFAAKLLIMLSPFETSFKLESSIPSAIFQLLFLEEALLVWS